MSLILDQQYLVNACRERLSGTLAVLYGGWSAEREISLLSGQAVLAAIESTGLPVVGIDVDRDIADTLKQLGVTHAFNALHGPYGEDGVLDGLLELTRISSTGSGVLAAALAMDKLRTKQLWRGIGVSTPDFVMLEAGTDMAAALARLGGKAMVKPSNEGSSIGMAIATNAEEMRAAFEQASQFDCAVLAEQFIEGREFSVPIVAGTVLPIIEMIASAEFYDYEAKYFSDETQYVCPAVLPDKQRAAANTLAEQAYRSLGCGGWGRVDLLQNADGEFFALEVNTIPGMTEHSLVPIAAKAAGAEFPVLVLNVLLESLQRNRGSANV